MAHGSSVRRANGQLESSLWQPARRRTEKKLRNAFRAGRQVDLRPGAGPTRLAGLNALPANAVRQTLLECCASARWAGEVAAGRPYVSVADVLSASDESVAGLARVDLEEALAGHPRIGAEASGAARQRAGTRQHPSEAGQRAGTRQHPSEAGQCAGGAGHRVGAAAEWSRQEQAGAVSADAATAAALADGNRRYEQRFGHIYLVCATGRSGAELLAILRERLGNDPEAEWGVVRAELGKINRIRLSKLLEGEA
jgi:2-oxo-4-hydroxy-4-carboxy-5-ureidoimidazoline decarboxylase